MADESDTSANGDRTAGPDTTPDDRPVLKRVPKLGVWAWSFVGVIAATIIVVAALAAVSEIVLPLLFAAVLAVSFKPAVDKLVHHKFKPALAAGLVVVGLIALMTGVVLATVRGVTGQTDQIGASVDAALHKAGDALGVDQASLDAARAAVEKASPSIGGGVLTNLVSGIDKLIGLASGLILGAMIMYYLLKDGTRFRRSIVANSAPRTETISTTSSATPPGSSATTGAAAPSCPPSWRRPSASPASCSASRSCSPSSWSTSSAATSPTSARSSGEGWP